jgi:photosystem II stability/assembly factor-like uncharacterized protein
MRHIGIGPRRFATVSALIALVLTFAFAICSAAAPQTARTVRFIEGRAVPPRVQERNADQPKQPRFKATGLAQALTPSSPQPGGWTPLVSGTTSNLWGAFAGAATDAWVVGEESTVLHTANGGSTWSSSGTGIPWGDALWDIGFVSATTGWTGGVNYLARTTDGGNNWMSWWLSGDDFPYNIDATSSTVAWGVGEFYYDRWYGCIYRHTYTGSLSIYAWGWPTDPYFGISMIDVNRGWVVGANGMIRKIANGTSSNPTFTAQNSNTTQTLWAVVAVDANTAYAVGNAGTIRKTTNGGSSWAAQASGTTANLQGIDCLNATTCLIAGSSGVVLRTENGTTWQNDSSGTSIQVDAVAMYPGVAYSAGLSGEIRKRACTAALTPTSASFGAPGGSGTVGVSCSAGCPWTAASNASWLAVTGGASGVGSGTVSYSVAANTGNARTGTLTIAGQTFTVYQAELPSLSIDNVTVSEGDAGTVNASFTVTLSTPSSLTVTVQYTTADGWATAPADYTASSGTLTFGPGVTSRPIAVPVQGDVLDEVDEYFTVRLSSPVNARIGQSFGIGTITDDDPTALSIDDVSVFEGHSGTRLATFTVGFPAPSAVAVGVDWATADQTAVAPGDYTAGAGPLTFAPGETSKQVSVVIIGDTDEEGDETFLVSLANPTNAVIGDGEGVGTILEDEKRMTAAALTLTPLSEGVLKSADTVEVQPSWKNDGAGATADTTGSATASNGGTIVDGGASYGVVGIGATAGCAGESDCYSVTASGPRPANHWDVKLAETLSWGTASHEWLLHVGDSFSDVPRTSGYFRFVETLYHKQVTGGCTATTYCPGSSTTRAQMAVFALIGKEGAGYSPVTCGPTSMFADVALTSPYCKWVEELARRGIAGGCSGGNYCPNNAVTRGQMAIFMLKTLDPTLDPPACGTTPMFADVPVSSPYCKWIEELARRGVVSGCGGGNYCPTNPVTRGQMGVFISATFGLTLYGP